MTAVQKSLSYQSAPFYRQVPLRKSSTLATWSSTTVDERTRFFRLNLSTEAVFRIDMPLMSHNNTQLSW